MRIRFCLGPWDGLECDVEYAPEKIAFRDLQSAVAFDDGESLDMAVETSIRTHDYVARDIEDSAGSHVREYHFQRSPKVWWES